MRSGYVYERPQWVPRIGASGGSVWPSPNAHDGRRPGVDDKSTQGANLNRDAAQWQTPKDFSKGSSATRSGDRKNELLLPGQAVECLHQAQQWMTPVANDDNKTPEAHMAMKKRMKGGERNTITSLAVQTRCFHQAPTTTKHGEPSSTTTHTSRRRLNPAFVSWLMGNPWWWTRAEPISFAAQEMELWRCRHRALLESLCDE